ncbi:MAG: AmmeMemoRadiSam system radical SAM enzyme [Candidatus Altiarchaeales archaeon]|nr:MAG: AmmeMemoRadiSam system radical SAM enzyme [Candidatus Altiarchaeales archaeon]
MDTESIIRGALLYERLDGKIRCGLCERRCFIAPEKTGFCKTRKNIDGRLYTLIYGNISAVESRPIEIKPFFHFWPGSTALTYSSWSCNLYCLWCQNWHLSKKEPDLENFMYIKPEEMVEKALSYEDDGLCVSFNEPTLLHEYNVDCFRLAKKKGLYNSYVSNGYMTLDALYQLKDSGLDAINIDVKGDDSVYGKYCKGINSKIVWRNIKKAKELNMHVEVVNLVVGNVNDDEKSLKWIIKNHLKFAGEETPLHFTRYFPAFRFEEPPTEIEILEKAYGMAKDAGILYPYLGNVHGSDYENTYCPNCNELLIQRLGYRVVGYRITEKKECPRCKEKIPIVGRYVRKR